MLSNRGGEIAIFTNTYCIIFKKSSADVIDNVVSSNQAKRILYGFLYLLSICKLNLKWRSKSRWVTVTKTFKFAENML